MIIMINTNAPENSHFSYLSYRNNYYYTITYKNTKSKPD